MRLHVVSWTAVLHYIYIIVAYIPYLACDDVMLLQVMWFWMHTIIVL